MARTGTNENKEANTQYTQAQTTALNNAAEDRSNYNKYVASLEAAGNPFEKSSYLQNENLAAATAAGAANQSAEEGIENAVGRSGTNSASMPYYRNMAAKNRARAASDSLVTQRAQDAINAENWKQWLAQAKLGTAGMDTNLYGTATSGRSNALSNLTQLGIASYGPMSSIIGAGGTIGAGLASRIGK